MNHHDNPDASHSHGELDKQAFESAAAYFPTPIQQFQFFDKYSRFDYEKGRRETWVETVDRSVSFLRELSNDTLPEKDYQRIRDYILEMKAAPSMRLLAMAGPAARRSHISIYNCSYLPMDSIDSFVEELIISMSGAGVGFSVERKYVDKLPEVKEPTLDSKKHVHVIEDSTEGWAAAFKFGLERWFEGDDVLFDYTLIREAGTPLKIKGGRASGPKPLKKMLDATYKVLKSRRGGKLRTIDAHDIACYIGEAIVSGGVRRTALISLFDDNDQDMLHSKDPLNIEGNEQRWMANNSAVWTRKVGPRKVLSQMHTMIDGQMGEPGIVSRYNANVTRTARRKGAQFGTNPCGEISLRPFEFCNLSMAIARKDDTVEDLKQKVEVATIIGTIQSMATDFVGLRPVWKKNCEEERLLGVDITGQMDCAILSPSNPKLAQIFRRLQKHAISVNARYAKKLGINQSVATTCVKPSGNSSQLFDCSSGLHPRFFRYYIRNVRVQTESPLRRMLADQGVPMDPENGQTANGATSWVIHFPVKAPDGAVTKEDVSAVDQCGYWLVNKLNWTEHNPSVTITYRDEEVVDLIKWVSDHRNMIGGMSFLPNEDARYAQAPYQSITASEYDDLMSAFPDIDFSRLPEYEHEDQTTSSQELACVSGACDILMDVPIEQAMERMELAYV